MLGTIQLEKLFWSRDILVGDHSYFAVIINYPSPNHLSPLLSIPSRQIDLFE